MKKLYFLSLISVLILIGCADSQTPENINQQEDLVGYLNPDNNILYVHADYADQVFHELGAKKLEGNTYTIPISSYWGEDFNLDFSVIYVEDVYYYSSNNQYLTVGEVMEEIIDEGQNQVDLAVSDAMGKVCNNDEEFNKLVDELIETVNNIAENGRDKAAKRLQHVKKSETEKNLKEVKEKNKEAGEEAKDNAQNQDECEQQYEFGKLGFRLRLGYDWGFRDTLDNRFRFPYGLDTTFTILPEKVDTTNLIHVFANSEGRFKVYKNATCYTEVGAVMSLIDCKKDADGFYYNNRPSTYSICRKGDEFCTEKYSPTAFTDYYSDSTCRVVSRTEGREFKYICR